MIKRFIKKIGRGIKKVGKAIGKPFKKLMKTKLGKVIGTIGMMMIGGWMLGGAKTFASGLFAGEGLTASFTNAMSNIGQSIGQSFTTITDGVKSMFSGGKPKPTNVDLANSAESVVKNIEQGVTPTDVSGQAKATTKTSRLAEGTELSSGKVVGDDALAKNIEKSLGNLPEVGSSGDMLKWDSATNKYIPKTEQELLTGKLELAMQEEPAKYIAQKKGAFGLRTDDITTRALKDPVTGEAIIPKGFREVDSLRKPSLLDKVYEMPFAELNKEYGLGFKPLKSFEKLPGILREGTVGEGIALSQALSSPPDPYIQGSSDMSGAISSLSQNEERLYSNMNMTDFTNGSMSQVPSPSTMRNPLQSYINNIQNAGYIYDSTLLAVKPSAIVPS